MDQYASMSYLRNRRGDAWAAHRNTIGVLSLRDGRLRWSDHHGRITFDHPVAELNSVQRRWMDLGTNLHFRTPDGTRWTCSFYLNGGYGRNQTVEEPLADPIGVPRDDREPGRWLDASAVCRQWAAILRETTAR